MTTPDSQETLLALLAEMTRPGGATSERSAAAREAIGAGHLGPPSEAFVHDEAGRAVPVLAWAIRWQDLEMVELLLERGASPLTTRDTRESVLRTAHHHRAEARGGEIFDRVRRAAREAGKHNSTERHGLVTSPLERGYVLRAERGRVDRGSEDLRHSVGSQKELHVLLVEAELKGAARTLAKLVQSPRREADVAGRAVGDAHRLAFLYRLDGIPWTILPLVFEASSMWNVKEVPELTAVASNIGALARALAAANESRVIHLRYDDYTVYSSLGGIETKAFDAVEQMTEELGQLSVFVPPTNVRTDGFNVQLELSGVEPSDVERVDVVVLQEFGDPDVDRTIRQPAAPPRVGLVTSPLDGQPPLVQEPHASAASTPTKSGPPPMVNAPPPMVSELPAAVNEPPALGAKNEPPAMASEPPAMASEPPAKVNEPPARVSEPPAKVGEPPASVNEPPAKVSEPPAKVNEPPAMMSEPPPLVTANEPAAMASEAPAVVANEPRMASAPPPMVSASVAMENELPPIVPESEDLESEKPEPSEPKPAAPSAAPKEPPPMVSATVPGSATVDASTPGEGEPST